MKTFQILFGIACYTILVNCESINIDSDAPSATTTTETNTILDNGCQKYPQMSPETPIKFDQISGTWHAIRTGPPCKGDDGEENHEMECMSETYWKEMDSPREEFKSIMSFRNASRREFWGFTGHLTYPYPDSKKIEPEMIFKSKIEDFPPVPCTVVGTDAGKTWLLWSCCMMFPPNVTNTWVIMSRTPFMDAKMEQTLVEFIGKTSGVTPEKLRGVKQTECY